MKPLCGENRTAPAVEVSRHGQSGEALLLAPGCASLHPGYSTSSSVFAPAAHLGNRLTNRGNATWDGLLTT